MKPETINKIIVTVTSLGCALLAAAITIMLGSA